MDISVLVFKNHQSANVKKYGLQVLVYLFYHHKPEIFLKDFWPTIFIRKIFFIIVILQFDFAVLLIQSPLFCCWWKHQCVQCSVWLQRKAFVPFQSELENSVYEKSERVIVRLVLYFSAIPTSNVLDTTLPSPGPSSFGWGIELVCPSKQSCLWGLSCEPGARNTRDFWMIAEQRKFLMLFAWGGKNL